MLEFTMARALEIEVLGTGRAHVRNAIVSAAYLLVGVGAIGFAHAHAATPLAVRAGGAAALGVASFLAWLAAMRRSRLVGDTPTTTVRGAPQGYVELVGKADVCPGSTALGVGMMPPCVWFKLKTYERQGSGQNNSVRVSTQVSGDLFNLVDATGDCVIDPDGAEVVTRNRRWWGMGDVRYEAWFLRPGEPIYALGDLTTERAADGTPDRRGDVAAVLREWKHDKQDLLRRYDTDHNGEIDMAEWQHAVADAERLVDERESELSVQPGVNVLRAPRDRRQPLLLSDRDPEHLMRHYRWWSRLHLAVLLGAIVYGGVLLGA